MTGNTSKWRAPLAGLASIAMLATMGVAASTANAATASPLVSGSSVKTTVFNRKAVVQVYDANKPYEVLGTAEHFSREYGQVVTADEIEALKDHQILDYLSFDKAGEKKVSTPYVVTGDVKLFAHYKDAVKVSFDRDGNPTTDTDRVSISVPKGTGLTASEYREVGGDSLANTPASDYTFAGWTTEGTVDASTSDALYTGAALDSDTVLYARYAKKPVTGVNTGKDLARVEFKTLDNSLITYLYTLNGKAFPAFRAPEASGSWKTTPEATAYDFSASVTNKDGSALTADLTLFDNVTASPSDVTVKFDSRTAKYTPDTVKTLDSKTIDEPTAPVRAGYVFTGWYTSPAYGNKDAKKYDFSQSVKANFGNTTGGVTLYAGWDDKNVSELVFNLGYKDFRNDAGSQITAQQVLFVRPGATVTLPNGLEEYFQTEAQLNAAKGEYTTKKLAGWYIGANPVNTVTSFVAPDADHIAPFTAKWTGASSLKLVANGGHFDGNATTKWVTKDDAQKWADVVVEPTSDQGGKFVQWRNNEVVYVNVNGTKIKIDDEGKLIANLSDGYWYTIKYENGQPVKDKPATYTDAGKNYNVVIADGAALKAEWAQGARVDIDGYRNQFSLRFGNANETQDVLTVAAYGYTDASAKAYVKAVNALEDEYAAYKALPEGQAKIDAANALAAKYEAAQALLVKSNGAEVPDGKVAVYRAFNPNETRGGSHLYTTSFTEYSSVVRAGWRAEGVQFQTTSSKTAAPVYRLYNKNDGSHHYTLSVVEKNSLVKAGWTYENVSWYVASDAPESVYRIYNANSGEHVFTLSKVEANAAVRAGWNDEGVAFKAYAK